MNTQRFRIACTAGATILFVAIVAFIVYDSNTLTKEERVYLAPDPIEHRVNANQDAIAVVQPPLFSDNNYAVQYSDESDSHDADATAQGKTVIELCCPEDEELTDIGVGQDSHLDSNPVTPELAADMKRDAEWYAAMKEYEKKYDALHAEGDRLDEEFKELFEKAKTLEGAALEALAPKLKAQIAKNEAWLKKLEALKQQRPVSPIPTHTH